MKRDEFGYINNRGVSKYYGVSWHWLRDKHNEDDTRWRVSIEIDGKTRNFTSDSHSDPLTEQQCAAVATHIRDNGLLSDRFIVSYNSYDEDDNGYMKQLLVNTRTNTIRKL